MKFLQMARLHGVRILTLAAIFGSTAVFLNVTGKAAYADAVSTQRSVRGFVVSPANQPISGAIVYLTNTRTMGVESYITQQDGGYRFEQLSPNDDYKVWAQFDGKKSKSKTLSSFDDRSVFHVILKIDAAK